MMQQRFDTTFYVVVDEEGTVKYGTEDERIIDFFETMRAGKPQLPPGNYQYSVRVSQREVFEPDDDCEKRGPGRRYHGHIRDIDIDE